MTTVTGDRGVAGRGAVALDPDWVLSLDMGPDPLALLDDALEGVELSGDVLDLGVGKGATSILLAARDDLAVTAVDLWVSAEENAARFAAAGVTIRAMQADARSLPFEAGAFDAVVSVDAWEYFGADRAALDEIARVLRPGGVLVVSTPALRVEPVSLAAIPRYVRDVVGDEALRWHTPGWWAADWSSSGLFDQVTSRWARDGWRLWLEWERASTARRAAPASAIEAMLREDGGRRLGFAVVVGRRSAASAGRGGHRDRAGGGDGGI